MSELPKSIATNTLWIGDVELVVHVLDNGQRVIEAESFEKFFRWLGDGGGPTESDAEEIAKILRTIQ